MASVPPVGNDPARKALAMHVNSFQAEQLMRQRMAEVERASRLSWMKADDFACRATRRERVRRALNDLLRLLNRPPRALALARVLRCTGEGS